MTNEELDILEQQVLEAEQCLSDKVDSIVRESTLKIKLEMATNPDIQAALAKARIEGQLDEKINALVEQGIKRSYYSGFNYVTSTVIAICQMVMYAGTNTSYAEAITGIKSYTAKEVIDCIPKLPYYSPDLEEVVNAELEPLDIPNIAILLPQVFGALGQDPLSIDPKVYNIVEVEKIHKAALKKANRKMKATEESLIQEAKLTVDLSPKDLD